jgi:hypothetical protein
MCFGELCDKSVCSGSADVLRLAGRGFHSQRERELEAQLSQKITSVKDLQRKVEAMEADVREVQTLRDEVDELRPAKTALVKAEV